MHILRAKNSLNVRTMLSVTMGIENMEFDKTLQKRTKKYIMNAYHDETHFIHIFLHKLPSGRLQTYKHRCAIGKACFLRHFILTVNDIFR